LIQKYSKEAQQVEQDTNQALSEEEQELLGAKVAALTSEVSRRKLLVQRLQTLQPCLEEDTPSARLTVALVILDAERTAESQRLKLRPSAEDACWALCSEKGQLIMEQLLPGVDAEGKWIWQDIRSTGLVWWLRKPVVNIGSSDVHNVKLLDQILTKCAQAGLARLKRMRAADPMPDAESLAQRRHVGDEIIFWYVLLGANIQKLSALFKTGMLEDEGVQRLLEHPRSSEAEMLRKNAFALLGKHRFFLAAALFHLGGFVEDAARVCSKNLSDLQLMLLATRKDADLARQLLQDQLEGSDARRDPWVKLLLSWHCGQLDDEVVGLEAVELDNSLPLFDGVLGGSGSAVNLPEVVKRMKQQV